MKGRVGGVHLEAGCAVRGVAAARAVPLAVLLAGAAVRTCTAVALGCYEGLVRADLQKPITLQ